MSFITFARAHGVDIDPSRLHASNKIKRCGTVDKPTGTNGAYLWDGDRGWVANWTDGGKPVWYNDPNAKPLTEQQRNEFTLKRADAAKEQEIKYLAASTRAVNMLNQCKQEQHNYLHLKGFPDAKGLVLEGRLIIPMRNAETNAVQGLQYIWWNPEIRSFQKKMLFGMRSKNAVMKIGPNQAQETFLVEGYATGLSLISALRSVGLKAAVVVCFSASNLVQVAPMITGNKIVFADNDLSGVGQKSAEATGLTWCMSDVVGEDANDIHKKRGIFALTKIIMKVRADSLKF